MRARFSTTGFTAKAITSNYPLTGSYPLIGHCPLVECSPLVGRSSFFEISTMLSLLGLLLVSLCSSVPVAAAEANAQLLKNPAIDKKVSTFPTLTPEQEAIARELDWVPLSELTEAQKILVPKSCCGAFIAPERTDVDANLDPNVAPMRASSEGYESDHQTHVRFLGKANITQGNRSIVADSAQMDRETHITELSGNIQMREPGLLVRADTATIETEKKEVNLENARFVLYESRVHGNADHLQKLSDNIVKLSHSEITSCEPGDQSWTIQGSEISLYPDQHYGTAQNMRLNVMSVPILYSPYTRFPLGGQRLTGFLFPFVGRSKHNGFETAVPFYWNISPDWDMTITPRYMSERGAILETDTRHLDEYFESNLSTSQIDHDRGGVDERLQKQVNDGLLTEAQAFPYKNKNRWSANFNQTGGLGRAWASNISYYDMSDTNYLRDINSGSVDTNRLSFVRNVASLDYRLPNWFIGAKSDEFRLLSATTQLRYRELPRIHADGTYQFADLTDLQSIDPQKKSGSDWLLTLNNEYVNFIKNRYYKDDTKNIIFGERFRTDYGLTWQNTNQWGFFKPGIGIKSLTFQLDETRLVTGAKNQFQFAVPQAHVDAGFTLERETSFGDASYSQTLEPRAFYFYSGYTNQNSLYHLTSNNSYVNFDTNDLTFTYDQLFRTTRFAGGDRLDDANQLSLAVSTAYIESATGLEKLRVGVGQMFYAADRRVTLYDSIALSQKPVLTESDRQLLSENTRRSSDLAVQVSSQYSQNLHVNADFAYDQRLGGFDNMSAGVRYKDEEKRIANLTYRYTFKPISTSPSQPEPVFNQALDQIDLSAVWPIKGQWNFIARSNHDFKHKVELDTFAGFEYDDCCYKARFIVRRWLRFNYDDASFWSHVKSSDYEPVVMFQLEFKGLGSTDPRVSSMLGKAIPGFSTRSQRNP